MSIVISIYSQYRSLKKYILTIFYKSYFFSKPDDWILLFQLEHTIKMEIIRFYSIPPINKDTVLFLSKKLIFFRLKDSVILSFLA